MIFSQDLRETSVRHLLLTLHLSCGVIIRFKSFFPVLSLWHFFSDQMSYLGRLGAEMKCLSSLFYFAILGGDSFVLPQMIGPRFSHKAFEVALRIRRVAKQVPADRAVALTYPPHLFHCLQKLVSGFRIDSLFHSSYGRTFRNFCIDQYYWFGPMQ